MTIPWQQHKFYILLNPGTLGKIIYMLGRIAKSLFGTANERYIKKLQPNVDKIEALEAELEQLSDEQIRLKTKELREKLKEGASLDDILVEAFAAVREAAKRTLGLRAYPVQLTGGIVLHRGQIAEMRTGEGKTLVSTFAIYLNALEGKGVHVVTVNDYLASRDAGWMGVIFEFLGLSVGCVLGGMDDQQRHHAYRCDITYGTNNEFGFDYLRDNMKYSKETMVQRPFNFAIIDEVDSILVDEARTPLIISGPSESHSDLYLAMDGIIQQLSEEDYEVDLKSRSIQFTEQGNITLEEKLRDGGLLTDGGLYDIQNVSLVHHATQAAMAQYVFVPNVDYMVKNKQVMIIDPFTGRTMEGRRWSNGLHQAVEAKEGVEIQPENQTLASITYQNYFRLYPKLAGMTGTAMTEAGEFMEIYNLEVIDIPTNVPVVREDFDDLIYLTETDKNAAVIEQIKQCINKGQPVLVGTASVEKSEELSKALKKEKIKHNVLNAKHHEREAEIIAQAGLPGKVTIATNMAGRGTDIKLGGNLELALEEHQDTTKDIEALKEEFAQNRQKVLDGGGLAVIGTERHESRRIDNQLRGRSGRQGDPGFSRFYLSLQDDLMKRFGSDKLDNMLRRFGFEEGESIEHKWVTSALERAQKRVEGFNFDARKQALDYDNVLNDQRKAIYEQRFDIMESEDLFEDILEMYDEVADDILDDTIPQGSYIEQWDLDALAERASRTFGINKDDIKAWAKEEGVGEAQLKQRFVEYAKTEYQKKKEIYKEAFDDLERNLLLQVIDHQWQEHLLTLDHLRQGIGLRAYGQRNPLDEYKREAFALFEHLLQKIREQICTVLSNLVIETQAEEPTSAQQETLASSVQTAVQDVDDETLKQWLQTVPRNAPCPCGSGDKFKFCHGRLSK